eukprot:7718239-Pyramimonas_sp.AAC.1
MALFCTVRPRSPARVKYPSVPAPVMSTIIPHSTHNTKAGAAIIGRTDLSRCRWLPCALRGFNRLLIKRTHSSALHNGQGRARLTWKTDKPGGRQV